MRVHQVIKERYMRLQKAPNDADHAGRIFVRLALCWYSYGRQYHTRSSVHVSTTDVPLVRCFIGAYYALITPKIRAKKKKPKTTPPQVIDGETMTRPTVAAVAVARTEQAGQTEEN